MRPTCRLSLATQIAVQKFYSQVSVLNGPEKSLCLWQYPWTKPKKTFLFEKSMALPIILAFFLSDGSREQVLSSSTKDIFHQG